MNLVFMNVGGEHGGHSCQAAFLSGCLVARGGKEMERWPQLGPGSLLSGKGSEHKL